MLLWRRALPKKLPLLAEGRCEGPDGAAQMSDSMLASTVDA